MKKDLAGVLFGSLVIVGLVAYAWRHSSLASATSGAPAPALSAQVELLRSEVAELRSRPRPGPQVVVLRPSGEIQAGTVPQPNAAMREPDPIEPATAEQQQQAMAEKLDRRLQSEPVDREWSRETSGKIRDVVEAPSVGGRVVEASCASRLCRVVVRHPSEAARVQFARDVVSQEPFNQGAIYRYSTIDGEPTTTVYVVRDDHALHDMLLDSSN
jgi:hypothetical protein